MPANVEIIPIPLGSQLVQSIGSNDPDDLNDFPCLLLFSENVSGLTLSNVSASSGSSIVSIEGENSVHRVMVRPQTTAGIVTITVAANAVNEGNPQTTKQIRVSTSFPDTDAETPTQLFSVNTSSVDSIAVSPTRLIISRFNSGPVNFYTHAGTEQISESAGFIPGKIDYFNNTLLSVRVGTADLVPRRYALDGTLLETYSLRTRVSIVHTRLGVMWLGGRTTPFRYLPYGLTASADVQDLNTIDFNPEFVAAQDDLIYLVVPGNTGEFALAQITDDPAIELLKLLNIQEGSGSFNNIQDIAIYRDTLYILQDNGSTGAVYTIDVRKYRPLSLNTKTNIPVVFADEGDTLDLTQFSPDAERFTFTVGSDKPSFLSINTNTKLAVASNAVTETRPVLVKLTAINRIDAVDLQFYLVIRQTTAPRVRDITTLTMRAGSTYDLFQIVDGADSIVLRNGRPRLAGSSLSNGVFRIGTTGGVAHFTARYGSLNSHFQINIYVVQDSDESNFSDVFRHRVQIAGINVSADILEFPTVSASIDAILLNKYRPNETTLSLKSDNTNNFRYNDDISGNFWESNNLNVGGFNERIEIFIEHLVDGNYISHLLFSGVISNSTADVSSASVLLECLDATTELQNTRVQDFGTLRKWDSLRRVSDEPNYEGVYMPDRSLLPMQIGTGAAWHDRDKLAIRELQLPSEGVPIENTAYMTDSELRTSDGFLRNNPVMQFKTQHRSEDVRFLVNQIGINKNIYNTEIDVPAVELDDPFILNRGSVPFSVSKTRIQRLITDWCYDSTNNRILMLLSNPEAHVADLLVQYNLQSDNYRILHTFDKAIKVHRIARRNNTNSYILTSKPISQDRSAPNLPRPIDSTGYAYDSAAAESEIKIYHYNATTDTLTEHVAEDDSYPPQLGIHYWVGFENDISIDAFEGIVPHYRGTFKWQSNNLYYRFAKDGEFGVARVDAAGATAKMIGEAELEVHNHLNFAFDVTSGGVVYFVYSTRDSTSSSLIIKRRAADGTVTTVLTEQRTIGGFLTEDTVGFGGFLGCYEALFHNNFLYVLCPIQTIDNVEDLKTPIATPITEIIDSGTGQGRLTGSPTVTNSPLALGADIVVRFNVRNNSQPGSGLNFDVNQSEFTIINGTLVSATRFSSSITLTIRPTNQSQHQNIGIGVRLISGGSSTLQNGYILIDFNIALSRLKSAGMALYRCNVTAATPSLEVLETYDFAQLGACNLIVHDGTVHFVENPPAATKFKPINPDLNGYWSDELQTQTMGYNIVPENQGQLKRISSSGTVERLGNLWYTDRPYNIAATRCLSIGRDLHLTMGYGNVDTLPQSNSLPSRADNFQHLVHTRNLHYIVPEFGTDASRFALLADLAKKTNATLSFENGLITLQDRSAYRAETNGATGTGTADIGFKNTNKAFPTTGYLLIEKEVIQYTDISGNAFTGITRGVLATASVSHTNNTDIVYVDKVLRSDDIQGRPRISTDLTRIYNIIRDPDNNVEARDPSSIALHGELPYPLNLGLTEHELAWQEHIFQSYLTELKDPKKVINMTLIPKNYLRVGHVVSFKYDELVYAVRIVAITYNETSTQIRGRTV